MHQRRGGGPSRSNDAHWRDGLGGSRRFPRRRILPGHAGGPVDVDVPVPAVFLVSSRTTMVQTSRPTRFNNLTCDKHIHGALHGNKDTSDSVISYVNR